MPVGAGAVVGAAVVVVRADVVVVEASTTQSRTARMMGRDGYYLSEKVSMVSHT